MVCAEFSWPRSFGRWNRLPDKVLYEAAADIEKGRYETALVSGVVKKRVAYPGRGKSGSARVLAAHLRKDAIIFIIGLDKNEPGRDFTDGQIEATKEIARGLQKATIVVLDAALKAGVLKEIVYDR